jgi:hypothetical protein
MAGEHSTPFRLDHDHVSIVLESEQRATTPPTLRPIAAIKHSTGKVKAA